MRSNLRRLAWLRGFAVAVLLAIRWVADGRSATAPGLTLLSAVAILAVVLTMATLWRCNRPWPVRQAELTVQLGADLLILTAAFHASGGAANPFVSLYLLPLVVAAATLPRIQVWLLCLLACIGYTWLLLDYGPLPGHHHADVPATFDLHVLGMWGNFLFSAGIVGVTVVNMATALRERDLRLARAREELLRSEQILGLATLAAGAAHELGTPLSTIAVLSRELEHECAERPEVQADLRLLHAQVGLCKDIIQRMLARNPAGTSQSPGPMAADGFLAEVIDAWRLMRPGVALDYRADGSLASAQLRPDATLRQALINVFNNAADASPAGVEIEATSAAGQICLRVLDRGPGITPGQAQQLGRAWFTTKREGRGLGLFLSNATLERLGGSVQVENRSGGGACTTIAWPQE